MSEQTLETKAEVEASEEIEDYRVKILIKWKQSIENIIEVGNLLNQANEKLENKDYAKLEVALPFSKTVASYLRKIANHQIINNARYYDRLPNYYNTLYYLADIDNKPLIGLIETKEVTPQITLAKAKELAKRFKDGQEAKAEATKPDDGSPILYEVGVISVAIDSIDGVVDFEGKLQKFLEDWHGSVAHTRKEGSLADYYRSQQVTICEKHILGLEDTLGGVTIDELRMLENAASHISKSSKPNRKIPSKSGKQKKTCLPDEYSDLAKLEVLTGKKEITRSDIKDWCNDNNVPCQLSDLSKIDRAIYVWEQARIVLAREDKVASREAMGRLVEMAKTSIHEPISKLAGELIAEIRRFKEKDEDRDEIKSKEEANTANSDTEDTETEPANDTQIDEQGKDEPGEEIHQ